MRDLDELHQEVSSDEVLGRVCVLLGLPLNTPSFTVFRVSRQRYYQAENMEDVCKAYGSFCEENRLPLFVGSWFLNSQPEPAI